MQLSKDTKTSRLILKELAREVGVVDETLYVRLKVCMCAHVINTTNLLVFKVHSFAVNQSVHE